MRILRVHNFYGSESPSGENTAFVEEGQMLAALGHEVETVRYSSDTVRRRGLVGAISVGTMVPWNPLSAGEVARIARRFSPDVLHVHNTFPLISPAIFYLTPKSVPRVLTLHNYRLFCAAAIPLRQGRTCTECLDIRSPTPAIRHGCYRGSRVATLPIAASIALHRFLRTWSRNVDAYVALTQFQRDVMVGAGLPADRVHVKPNCVPGNPRTMEWTAREPYAVYVGRLSEEKGVRTLVRGWRAWGPDAPILRIVGDGPLRKELEAEASGFRVEFTGLLPALQAQRQIACARLLILPSECYEGFPMVILEAFGMGTPVAVAEIGPLPIIVKHGYSGMVFSARNPASMVEVIRAAWPNDDMMMRLAAGARREFESRYSEEVNHATLMKVYECARKQSPGAYR